MSGAVAALIIIIVILVIGYLYLRRKARKQALEKKYGYVPSHEELYFEEYFDDIIDSWDLVKKEEAQEWADKMENRLEGVSKEIEGVKERRKKIDSNLDSLEERIDKFE